MPAEFDDSRTAAIIEAEAAHGGPQPVAALILIISAMLERGAPFPFVKGIAPTVLQAVVLARGEREETVKNGLAALDALAKDLTDVGAGRL